MVVLVRLFSGWVITGVGSYGGDLYCSSMRGQFGVARGTSVS